MKPFEYNSPQTLADAARLLGDYGGQARVLAGGTDLLIRMKRKQWTPRALVNLKRIPGLRALALDERGELHIGALVTLNDMTRSPIVRDGLGVLARTAAGMAGVQVRNLATVGGNLCNASPAADMAPPLMALQARAVAVSSQGERVIPLDEFFFDAGRSALAPGEILREILVPPPNSTHASYVKLEHRAAMDIAIVGVAVSVQFERGKTAHAICADARIVLGAVAPTPLRALQAEKVLRGQELTEERIRQAAATAAREAKPIDDVRGSAWYRTEMVEVLTRRQLMELSH